MSTRKFFIGGQILRSLRSARSRPLRAYWIWGGAMLLVAGVVLAQQDFSKVEIKVTKVSGTIYMLEGSGGNIGACVGSDGLLLVDDQFAPLAPQPNAPLKQLSHQPIHNLVT